jgi:hypothetical protein
MVNTVMNRRVTFILLLLAQSILVACSVEPEVIVVEITRLVPEIEEVEVTRLVEVEKEVTRIIEVPAAATRAPGSDADAGIDLEFMQLEFWPDYDKPSVLVLITGAMPAGAALPAEIIIPVPPDAEINAVAEITGDGMTSIDYGLQENTVLFQSSSPEFRVEYYVPYAGSGSTHSYDFEWLAPFSINRLAVQIQRPINASELAIEPAPSRLFSGPSDSLDYYLFDSRSLPQGNPFRLRFSYDMTSDVLTADELNSSVPNPPDNQLHNQQARYNSEP